VISKSGLPPDSSRRRKFNRKRSPAAGSRDLYAETLEMMERYLITRVLRETEGNRSQAAERLGITRGSLRHKIRSLGIAIEHIVQPGKTATQRGVWDRDGRRCERPRSALGRG
jgi:DNA-binding NtrC family response regulator